MRSVPPVLALLALTAASAASQTPTPRPTPSATATEKQFLGTWEGPYQSDQAAPGELRLVIVRDTVLKATLTVLADQPIEAGEITELKVDGNTISWVQDIMAMTCRAFATLSEGLLKGDTSCEQGGAVAITARWVLIKK